MVIVAISIDAVLRTYLWIAAGILLFAGTAIVLIKFVLRKNA